MFLIIQSRNYFIVDLIGTIDDKVENNEQIIVKLDKLIMHEYTTFASNLKSDSEVVPMEKVFDISIGKTPPRKEYEWFSISDNDIKWLSISDLGNSFYYVRNTSEYLTQDAICRFNVKVVPKGTVVLSFKLTVGKIGILFEAMATNEAIAHFVTDNSDLTEYLYCYLRNYNFDSLGNTSSIATAVNSKTIKAMPFTLPTKSELAVFKNNVKLYFDEIKSLQTQSEKLKTLKVAYLKKFFG